MLFKNVCFYNEIFEKETADILIENGRIAAIGVIDGAGRDMSSMLALPGFVDIHIHGGAGGDFSDGCTQSLDKMSLYLAENGITSFCGTSMTLDSETLVSVVKCARAYRRLKDGAKLVGINLEGPYISQSKKGAQNGDYIRRGSINEFNFLFDESGGLVRLITIAPEAFDSDEFIRQASKKCTVSLGHSAADAEKARRAFDIGASHVTHLYNAMTPMNHRNAGLVGTALDSENVMCELICDGKHICPAVLRNTFRILGDSRACVISDSMRAAGLGAGEFELGGQKVFVPESRECAYLSDGTIAASVSNLFDEFRNLISYGIDFKTALKSCTINPARAVKLDGEIGSIAVGKAADIVFTDGDLNIKEVYINGTLTQHSTD